MGPSAVRVLVVDDFEPWRRFVCAVLQEASDLRVIDEACDGLEAVEKAEEFQPDLILLDIGLPTLNGVEAAQRIRALCPATKIIFVTETRSSEIASEALPRLATGYVIKACAGTELLPAIAAVLGGKQFVSADLPVAMHARSGGGSQS